MNLDKPGPLYDALRAFSADKDKRRDDHDKRLSAIEKVQDSYCKKESADKRFQALEEKVAKLDETKANKARPRSKKTKSDTPGKS